MGTQADISRTSSGHKSAKAKIAKWVRLLGESFVTYRGIFGTLFDRIGLSKPHKLVHSASVPGPGGLMCLSHVGGDRPRHPMSLASRHRSLVRKSRWSAE